MPARGRSGIASSRPSSNEGGTIRYSVTRGHWKSGRAETQSLRTAVDLMQRGKTPSVSDAAEAAGVSRATAYRELTALCEMGVLVQTGVGRGTRYKLSPAVSESRY